MKLIMNGYLLKKKVANKVQFFVRVYVLFQLIFLQGCYWQEQLCYMGKDPQLIQKEFYYDDCDAIGDKALRGSMVNQ